MNNEIPIFDSLTHPYAEAVSSQKKSKTPNTIDDVLGDMRKANVKWAFAVGMGDSFGGYRETTYAKIIKESSDCLFPVAYINPNEAEGESEAADRMGTLRELGYVGIKLHPRMAKFCIDTPKVATLIRSASSKGLVTFLCTYCYERSDRIVRNSFDGISSLLSLINEDDRVILLHGGTARLLEYIELARAHSNVMLDLSFTICKYQGSSLDLDLAFAFQQFDRRICIGSDSPEFSCCDLRRRFEQLREGISQKKAENIAFRNLFRFMKWEVPSQP
jgi:predicted TIM-barrel fold metal-dependent hydrolase